MPGINFNYTKFLREQHEKYIKKYGDDLIKAEVNPQPVAGFSGHVPYYRGSLHELRVVRSLVRCINSPMKPTTATGFRTKSRQFYQPDEDDDVAPQKSPQQTAQTPGKANNDNKPTKAQDTINHLQSRVKSAPAALSRQKQPEGQGRPSPSSISMMAAGSAALLKSENTRPQTAYPGSRTPKSPRSKESTPKSSSRSSASSIAPPRLPTPVSIPEHPTGYPQTLYGSSYWYAWPGQARSGTPRQKERPDSYVRDRRLTRQDGVLYHRHEGLVPKYLGYVPGYKFRHGSTFGVLTVNATPQSVAHRLAVNA